MNWVFGPLVHAVAVIDGRRLYLLAIPNQARVRIMIADPQQETAHPLGSVIRLDTATPGLRVCTPLDVEWGDQHATEILDAAAELWDVATGERDD